MVKFNFWDSFYGKKPKTFKRESRKQIEENTLWHLKKFGRFNWISTEQIFKDTIEETDLFNSKEGRLWFAEQGIKSKINSATHKLRRDGHPIISGLGKKGYKYADENCDDFIYAWDEKFSAWEGRKSNIVKERKTDIELIKRLIEKLINQKRLEEAKQLQEVLVKYEN